MPHKRLSVPNRMMSPHHKTSAFFISTLCALMASGCQENAPKATSANLEVARVQGVRFDEPLAANILSDAPPVATPASVTYADSDSATSVANSVLPTAADVPDNIAMIPSATPATAAPTPDLVPDEPDSASVKLPSDPNAFASIPFKVLSGYKYVEPVPGEGERPEDVEARRESDQIPAEVKALDGKKAILEGWMVPMEVSEDGSVKSFILVQTQPQCCFGDMQAMNEWVDVVMQPGSNADFNVDIPVKVYGQLEVGEKMEDGFVLSIYRMKANRVDL